MLIRHAVFASIISTAILVGCNKHDEMQTAPAVSGSPSAAPTMPAAPMMTPPSKPDGTAGNMEKKP